MAKTATIRMGPAVSCRVVLMHAIAEHAAKSMGVSGCSTRTPCLKLASLLSCLLVCIVECSAASTVTHPSVKNLWHHVVYKQSNRFTKMRFTVSSLTIHVSGIIGYLCILVDDCVSSQQCPSLRCYSAVVSVELADPCPCARHSFSLT